MMTHTSSMHRQTSARSVSGQGYTRGAAQQLVARRPDSWLLYATITLVLMGLMAVYTSSAAESVGEFGNSFAMLLRQVLAVVAGFLVMGVTSRIHFKRWKQLAVPASVVSVLLLLATMFFGVTANGSERWIPLAFGFQLQPSEIAKVAAILLMAQATSLPRLVTPLLLRNLVLVFGMIFLIYQQPSLSVSMIVTAITGIMLFAAGTPLLLFLAIAPVALFGLYHKIRDTEYQWKRIVGWLQPWADPQGTGYNLIQSYFAVGSGGLLGVGFGRSVQKLYYLPFHHTDFIFSIICEEMGFVGAFILIALFVLLGWRGFYIALHCPSRFGQMLALGITCAIMLQAIINISVTIGLMPVTGVTLPLISYGGTSMVITLAMIGILMNISRYELRVRHVQQME